MSENFDIPIIQKPSIKLYGITGEFSTPNSNYVVRYFSTNASNKNPGDGPHMLLKAMRPMREALEPSKIDDISALLQRDLNDSRIANELVPYLLGEKSEIAFFPAVLAVLLPKNFFNESSKYPNKAETEDGESYKSNNSELWRLKKIQSTPLAVLDIYETETNILVLDGQHRTNAFRVVSGDFFEDRGADLYEPFYSKIPKENHAFASDLPVTIIWFETKDQSSITIDHKLISRKLFIDVNNSAKPVSESRTILLNDFEASSVSTRLFYSFLASKASFQSNQISLVNSGFDVDSDLQYSKPNMFTITTPQIIHYAIDWILFGSRRYSNLEYFEVQKEKKRNDTSQCKLYLPQFGEFLKLSDQDGDYSKFFDMDSAQSNWEAIEEEFNNSIAKIFSRLFNEFCLTRLHFDACSEIEKKRETWSSLTKKETLSKVFFGGEGLYYSYKNISKDLNLSEKIKDIKSAIDEIENDLAEQRKELLNSRFNVSDIEKQRINKAFDSLRTKAFQVGFFMAFFDFYQISSDENINYDDVLTSFIEKLNVIEPIGWINILNNLRPLVIGGTDPKKWPTYHKIVLRVIDSESNLFFGGDNVSKSIEVVIFRNILIKKIDEWVNLNDLIKDNLTKSNFDENLRLSWYENISETINNVFEKCNLKVYEHIDFSEIGESYFDRTFGSKNQTYITEEDNDDE